MFMLAGCSDKPPEVSDIEITLADDEVSSVDESDCIDAEGIIAIYRDIFDEAVETNVYDNLEVKRRIVDRLWENGYIAVDSGNQVDMAGAERTVEFCKAVDNEDNDKITIIVIRDIFGFWKFDLQTEGGKVNVVRGYYQYDQNGHLQNRSTVSYPADVWEYTAEGYLIFEGSYFSDENFILTLSDTPEHTALRVLPLDEKCRELNRKYILPIGYERNNIFLIDWNEENFGNLDFYDIFDNFYPILNGQAVPYSANENLGEDSVYQIPENLFENVIMTYFNIDRETIREKTVYSAEDAAYEYRVRGFYEVEYPDIPYPEVVNYKENEDGTITLIINAVYPNENTSKSYSHKVVIRPLSEDCFQYVSNQMITAVDEYDVWWHSDRLTEEQREKLFPKETYGGEE